MFAGLSNNVDLHLEQLQREGLLKLGEGDDGTVSLPRLFPQIKRIGVRGHSISPQSSLEDNSPSDSIVLDLCAAGIALDRDVSAHVVGDDSMSDAGIRSGDVAILRTTQPDRGEIVAVEVSGHLALRRYVIISGIPHFIAENPVRPDLIVAFNQPILGVLACLICGDPNGLGRTLPPIKKINYEADGGLATGSMLESMLKAEAKRTRGTKGKRTVPTSVTLAGTGLQKKVTPRPSKKISPTSWPKTPTGIALNDKRPADFGHSSQRFVCDEKPEKRFGGDFIAALASASRECPRVCDEEKDQKYGQPATESSAEPAAYQPSLEGPTEVGTANADQAKFHKGVKIGTDAAPDGKRVRQRRSFLRV